MTPGEHQADLCANLRVEARELRREADRISSRAVDHGRAGRREAAVWCRALARTMRRYSRWALDVTDPLAPSGRFRSVATVEAVLADLEDALVAHLEANEHDAILDLMKRAPDALADAAEKRQERTR